MTLCLLTIGYNRRGNITGVGIANSENDAPEGKMEKPKFEHLLERVRIELLNARLSFSTWKSLSLKTEDVDDIEKILNAYRGFFKISRNALLDHCFIKIGNITEPNLKKAPSFFNVLRILDNLGINGSTFDISGCREKLKKHRAIERKVRNYRDKKAAHSEIGAILEPIHIGEMETLLDNLEAVFHDIYGFKNPGEQFSFTVLEHADTDNMITALARHSEVVPQAEGIAWMAVKNESDPDTYLVESQRMEKLMDTVGRPY